MKTRALLLVLAIGCGSTPMTGVDGSVDGGGPRTDTGTMMMVMRDSGPRPTNACPEIAVADAMSVDGFLSDVYTWRDARCQPRSAAMVHNDVMDPTGKWGGYLRQYVYDAAGRTRTCNGSFEGHPGFGYTVNHYGDTASIGYSYSGTYRRTLSGRHHAIHEYHWTNQQIDGHDVVVTIQWMFATGRDHPLWAITFDLNGVPADAVSADTRSPYGDMVWDGEGADVAGVSWGDRYRFVSLASPISLNSGWDYTQPNVIPFAMEWTTAPDAEMSIVQTQTWMQHDGGGYWNYSAWGTRDDDGPMPMDWNWTYQLNQYELPFPGGQRSHRLAWGANYGAVGQRQYNAYGDDRQLSGWPYQSYAVFIVFGLHSENATASLVSELEAVQDVRLTASEGTVAMDGPAGTGRTDTAAYQPAGWDPVHAVWTLVAAGNRVTARIQTGARGLARPIFHVRDWNGADPAISLGDQSLVADVDYYASVDAASHSLWLTLASDVSGDAMLHIE